VIYSVRLLGGVVALAAIIGFAAGSQAAPPSTSGIPKLQRDGSINIAGRNLRCGKTRNVLDVSLPSEGAAAPGVLIINPRLINRMPEIVRLFVFHHECGHHNIGASELRADTWAVERGVAEGWLDKEGLKQVCRSFGNMPATPTHPSGGAVAAISTGATPGPLQSCRNSSPPVSSRRELLQTGLRAIPPRSYPAHA